MVGKCFKGLTDELLDWQTKELLARKTTSAASRSSSAPSWWSRSRSTACTPRSATPAGSRLRFARVKRYRPDKDAAEADTLDDLRALLPAA